MSEASEPCPVCARRGELNTLKLFQVNLGEAVKLCTRKECSFPVGCGERLAPIPLVSRDASKLAVHHVRGRSGGRTPFSSRSSTASSGSGSRCSTPSCAVTHAGLSHSLTTKDDAFEVSSVTDTSCSLGLPSNNASGQRYSPNADVSHVCAPTPDGHISGSGVGRLQWRNKHALCWLDVTMCLLVHCQQLRRLFQETHSYAQRQQESVLCPLLATYDQAQTLFQMSLKSATSFPGDKTANLETSVGTVLVKTGGGEIPLSNVAQNSMPHPVVQTPYDVPVFTPSLHDDDDDDIFKCLEDIDLDAEANKLNILSLEKLLEDSPPPKSAPSEPVINSVPRVIPVGPQVEPFESFDSILQQETPDQAYIGSTASNSPNLPSSCSNADAVEKGSKFRLTSDSYSDTNKSNDVVSATMTKNSTSKIASANTVLHTTTTVLPVGPATETSGSRSGEMCLAEAGLLLEDARERVFESLRARLRCEKGKDDTPVFALMMLFRESQAVTDIFNMAFTWHLKCSSCGHEHVNPMEKTLTTFPNTPLWFSMTSPGFLRTCFRCQAPGQRMNMSYTRLPKAILIHFVEGLPRKTTWPHLDFTHAQRSFRVTAVIQHKTSPDHFVAWLRDPVSQLWMECDDMKKARCKWSPIQPCFDMSQAHVVMWEEWPPSGASVCAVAVPPSGMSASSGFTPVSSTFSMEHGPFPCTPLDDPRSETAPIGQLSAELPEMLTTAQPAKYPDTKSTGPCTAEMVRQFVLNAKRKTGPAFLPYQARSTDNNSLGTGLFLRDTTQKPLLKQEPKAPLNLNSNLKQLPHKDRRRAQAVKENNEDRLDKLRKNLALLNQQKRLSRTEYSAGNCAESSVLPHRNALPNETVVRNLFPSTDAKALTGQNLVPTSAVSKPYLQVLQPFLKRSSSGVLNTARDVRGNLRERKTNVFEGYASRKSTNVKSSGNCEKLAGAGTSQSMLDLVTSQSMPNLVTHKSTCPWPSAGSSVGNCSEVDSTEQCASTRKTLKGVQNAHPTSEDKKRVLFQNSSETHLSKELFPCIPPEGQTACGRKGIAKDSSTGVSQEPLRKLVDGNVRPVKATAALASPKMVKCRKVYGKSPKAESEKSVTFNSSDFIKYLEASESCKTDTGAVFKRKCPEADESEAEEASPATKRAPNNSDCMPGSLPCANSPRRMPRSGKSGSPAKPAQLVQQDNLAVKRHIPSHVLKRLVSPPRKRLHVTDRIVPESVSLPGVENPNDFTALAQKSNLTVATSANVESVEVEEAVVEVTSAQNNAYDWDLVTATPRARLPKHTTTTDVHWPTTNTSEFCEPFVPKIMPHKAQTEDEALAELFLGCKETILQCAQEVVPCDFEKELAKFLFPHLKRPMQALRRRHKFFHPSLGEESRKQGISPEGWGSQLQHQAESDDRTQSNPVIAQKNLATQMVQPSDPATPNPVTLAPRRKVGSLKPSMKETLVAMFAGVGRQLDDDAEFEIQKDANGKLKYVLY